MVIIPHLILGLPSENREDCPLGAVHAEPKVHRRDINVNVDLAPTDQERRLHLSILKLGLSYALNANLGSSLVVRVVNEHNSFEHRNFCRAASGQDRGCAL